MSQTVRCPECSKVYRDLEALEDLSENDSICMACNAPIPVADWDQVLSSYNEDEDALPEEEIDEDWAPDDNEAEIEEQDFSDLSDDDDDFGDDDDDF